MTFQNFLNKCIACGGNLTSMVLSGIKEVAPEVFEAMPERAYAFDEACFIANHLCHDRPHFRYNLSRDGNVIEYTPEGQFAFYEATEEMLSLSDSEFHEKYNL